MKLVIMTDNDEVIDVYHEATLERLMRLKPDFAIIHELQHDITLAKEQDERDRKH